MKSHPVVVVIGARQTGKTTLVRHLPSAPSRHFETLDDIEALSLARKRPEDLIARGRRLTLDEVQRAPELLLAIKRDVDESRRRGRFLLTGSANLLLMRDVADSLAGRAVYVELSPFTGSEKRGEGGTPPWGTLLGCKRAQTARTRLAASPEVIAADWRSAILTGGMPPAALSRTNKARQAWFEGFVRTYLERDLRDLSSIASLPDFRTLMGLAAHRIGGLLNQTELARDAGMSQATAHRYLNLLDVSFQTYRLRPYTRSPSKRLIKSPKLYWRDSGLASHLIGLDNKSDLQDNPIAGALLENLVLTGLLAWRETLTPRPDIHYWRTAGGAEVDFVLESRTRLLPVEVKASARIRVAELRHLDAFLDDYPDRAGFGVVLHSTDEPHIITRRIVGLPVGWFV